MLAAGRGQALSEGMGDENTEALLDAALERMSFLGVVSLAHTRAGICVSFRDDSVTPVD